MQNGERTSEQEQPRPSTPVQASTPSVSRRKRMVFRIVMLLLVLLLIEGVSSVVIWIMPDPELYRTNEFFEQQSSGIRMLLQPDAMRRIEIHPQLGWRYAPNFKSAEHEMNSKALRSSREYRPNPAPQVLRVAAFGDSFVYSNEVDNANAWAALMEADDPKLEVLNYGVGGYGIDQAYLRYTLEGADLSPHIVVIAFTTDDLGRVINVYRRFLDFRDLVLFKPRYLINENNELTLVEPPVRDQSDYERLLDNPAGVLRFAEHDRWYRPSVFENPVYDYSAAVRVSCWLGMRIYRKYFDSDRLFEGAVFSTTSTAFRIHVALLRKFAAEAKAAGVSPVILFLPEQESVRRARTGEKTPYQPLLDRLQEAGLSCLDAAQAFRDQGEGDVKDWFAPRGHYSVHGNRVVANWLRQELPKHGNPTR